MARTGKIARLPHDVREEVNERLRAGHTARAIIDWLHSRDDVLRVLDEHFDEQPITAQNITEWRQGGYQEWLERGEKAARVRELSQYAARIAGEGGGDLMQSGAAIAGGQLLEILEGLDVESQRALITEKPETYIDLLDKLARLQKSGAEARRAKQAEDNARLAQEKLDLERAKFRRQTAEKFLEWRENERAKEIADAADLDRGEKIDALVAAMWGEKPEDV